MAPSVSHTESGTMSIHRRQAERSEQWLALIALLATWALVHAALVTFRDVAFLDGALVDPDSYMRLVRVRELVQEWQWFDSTIGRANAPYGDTLHWSRPFDLLILGVASPAMLAVGMEQALYFSGLLVSPLVQLATALLLIWTLRPVTRPTVWFLPALALFLQPGALAYSIVGRADHHALMLLVFVAVIGFMLRALLNPLDSRPALLAGATAGFGMWLSVEFLLVVGLCLLALGLAWLFGERERAAQSKWYALGLSLVILAALFSERPLERLFEPSYDSISSAQLVFAVAVLLFWRTAETLEGRRAAPSRFVGRALLGTLGAGAVSLLVVGVYPLFLAGPMADVDPRIVPIWLDKVLEMRPMVPVDRSSFGTMLFFLGGLLVITPPFLLILLQERGSPRFSSYAFIALGCVLLGAVAIRHVRFSGYAEIACLIALAIVLDRFLQWSGRIGSDLLRGFLRGGLVSVLLLGPIVVGGALMAKPGDATDAGGQALTGCKVREVAAFLESDSRWSAAPQTVLAFMDIGPELLYRTRHEVIGTPYHRNGEGIFDGYSILATSDLPAAQALVEGRGIDLVLLCQSPAERTFYAASDGEETLYKRLDRRQPPAWLEPVALPESLEAQAKLYRVLR